jgi:hypothetical protein
VARGRQSRRWTIRLRSRITTFHNKITDNKEVFDFYSNIISSLLTLIALGTTIYFSVSALQKTDEQNKNAAAQLILAQKQFEYSKQLHTEDSLASEQKDAVTNGRFIQDTIKQSKQAKYQDQRNLQQDKSNQLQYHLNQSQLRAIQIQASTAEAQFRQQQEQYKQQLYEQRPVFSIDSVRTTLINSVKSSIRFVISNKGIRPAHIDSTVIAFYNPQELCFSTTSMGSNLDLIAGQNFMETSSINIYNPCLQSQITVYYLVIYYKDRISGVSRVEPIFFHYEYSKQHQFLWARVTGKLRDDFAIKLKRKNILVID